MNHFDDGHLINTAARGAHITYTVTIQLRDGSKHLWIWSSLVAKDVQEAIELSIVHLKDEDKVRVARVAVEVKQ